MKKTTAVSIVFAWVFLVYAVSVFLGCEGEQGPAGPAGSAGTDVKALCGTCHDVTTSVLAKQVQWASTAHATGGSWGRGSSDGCAACHSHEGFTIMITEGIPPGSELEDRASSSPTSANCRTCHNIHKNYDETDYALATTAAVELTGSMYTGGVTIDLGKGNLCANCHQTRLRGYEEDGLVPGSDAEFEIPGHYSLHHGVQANFLTGNGAFEVAGSLEYTNSYHATGVEDGCVTCHVHEGDHTFEASEDACAVCHTDIDGIDEYRGVQDEFAALFTELEVALVADSLLVSDGEGGYEENEDFVTTANKAGALLNYMGILDDGSDGIHNTKYLRAMLQNSIEVFE